MSFCIDAIQHIGIPTQDFEATIRFYERLGFDSVHTNKTPDGKQVAFLRPLAGVCIETYEVDTPSETAGAINHIALNCSDIQSAFNTAVHEGMTILSNGIEELPFWDNGIRFFIIEGPNKEKVEFCQIL